MNDYIYLVIRKDNYTYTEEVVCAFYSESNAHKYKESTKTLKGTYLFVEPIEIMDGDKK